MQGKTRLARTAGSSESEQAHLFPDEDAERLRDLMLAPDEGRRLHRQVVGRRDGLRGRQAKRGQGLRLAGIPKMRNLCQRLCSELGAVAFHVGSRINQPCHSFLLWQGGFVAEVQACCYRRQPILTPEIVIKAGMGCLHPVVKGTSPSAHDGASPCK